MASKLGHAWEMCVYGANGHKEILMHRGILAARILSILESPELCSKCLDNDEERLIVAEALTDVFFCEACDEPLRPLDMQHGTCTDCATFIEQEKQDNG